MSRMTVRGPGGESWAIGLEHGVWRTLWPYLAMMFNVNFILGVLRGAEGLGSLKLFFIYIPVIVSDLAMSATWFQAVQAVRKDAADAESKANRSYLVFRSCIFLVGAIGLLLQMRR